MKIGELEEHCENCPLIDYCTEPYEKPELCTIEELSDVDTGTYKEYAEALTEDDIKRKIGEYEENGFYDWSDERTGAICDLVLERIFAATV